MANSCTTSKYFSGQGSLLLATRSVLGKPEGLVAVGNVSALSLSVETTEFEHKESCTGTRGIDLTIVQEINATLSMTMESLSKENLALALYGTSATVGSGSVTDEAVIGYHDKWSPLENIKVSAVVVTNVGGATTYVEDTDYEVNYDAGAIRVLSTGTITDAQALEVDYSYAAQETVDAITSGAAPVRYARFEGLNTADTNKPVIIDFYKLSIQPLAELALINDEISQMEVESKLLSDSLVTVGSKYFKIRMV